MRTMDLRQVEIFYYVAKFRSFSKAAAALLLTQPTISGHIKALEESLAVVLFDRLGREICLTRAGEVLYGYAKRLLSTKAAALQALLELQEFARFTVRGEITRDQVIAVETDNGAGKSTALVCVRIGPESEINIVDTFSGDYPGVLEEMTLYSSDSWLFGLPTIAVSGDRTSIVVYEGDRANRIAPTNVRYELRMQYDSVTKAVTGGGSEERNVDWGNWRDHEIAALFNVLALVRSGTDRVTLRISFDRGATFLQEETLGQPLSPWTARLAQIAMAADYTLGVLFWQATAAGGTNLLLVEGRPSAFDGGGSPTAYAFDPPRVVHAVAGDVMPIIMGMTYSRGGDLAIGYAYSTMVRNEVNVTTTTSSFRSAVRLFGSAQFFDVLVDEDTIISKDPSVSVVGEGETMRVFYAYEGRNGIVLRTSEDAGRTWSGPIPIGDRSAHMATVIARETPTGNKLDVLYLAYSGAGLELHMRHWEDFDTEPPQTYRLTEAKIEYPATALSVFAPGPSPRVTEVAWFGYDAVLDGDDIVIVHHQATYDGYAIAPGLPTALGVPETARDSGGWNP